MATRKHRTTRARKPATKARTGAKARARSRPGRGGGRMSVNVTGLQIGSLISFNFGGRGRSRGRAGGGLWAALSRFASGLKGADYPRIARPSGNEPARSEPLRRTTRRGSAGGGFEAFRASRPDLFPDQDTDRETDDTPDETDDTPDQEEAEARGRRAHR